MPDTSTHRFLTINEVLTLTRLSRSTIYKLAASGEIPCHKIRRRLLFPTKEIDKWIENNGQLPICN